MGSDRAIFIETVALIALLLLLAIKKIEKEVFKYKEAVHLEFGLH
jgi:hypothetical protein